jgi:hypothetical protein
MIAGYLFWEETELVFEPLLLLLILSVGLVIF